MIPKPLHPLAIRAGCLVLAAAGAFAADTHAVLGVAGPDRVVVELRGMPVALTLAHLDVPADEAARADCAKRLAELVQGKQAEVVYRPGFGVDDAGSARVHLVVNKADVVVALIAAGAARYQAGKADEPAFDPLLRAAQAKAEKAKAGLWASGAAVAAKPKAADDKPKAADDKPASPAAKPAAVAAKLAVARGPICALLDSPYWMRADSPEAAAADAARLIYYPDEAAAKRAGKKAKPAADAAAAGVPRDEAGADAVFARGKELYAQAIAKGNTPERDQAYEQAFTVLSSALGAYTTLAEARPDDEALAEKLRECSQLRYGTIKQRRF